MQATDGWCEGHRVMLEAANEGANPSGGPLNRSFSVGNREISMRSEYMRMMSIQMCGRLSARIEKLSAQHWNRLGEGNQNAADRIEEELKKYKELLEIAEYRRDHPDTNPAEVHARNPVPESTDNSQRET